MFAAGWITARIYGIVGGVRALVASGRQYVNTNTSATHYKLPPAWIASARAIADRFEVSLAWTSEDGTAGSADGTPGTTYNATIGWGIMARQTAPDLIPNVGAVTHPDAANWILAGAIAGSKRIPPQLELVALHASSKAAAPRFIHVVDWPAVNSPPTVAALQAAISVAPVATFPIGVLADQRLVIANPLPNYRANGVLLVVAASTTNLTAIVTDCEIGVTVR